MAESSPGGNQSFSAALAGLGGSGFGRVSGSGGGEGLRRAFLGEMGRFAVVLAENGPVKTDKTGGEAGKSGGKAIIPGGLAADPGGLAAGTGVGAAVTPVGAAATGGGAGATVSGPARQESAAFRQVSARPFRGDWRRRQDKRWLRAESTRFGPGPGAARGGQK
jgi:hypothetical protein